MARKYFQIKTSDFNDIWAKANKTGKDWDWFINAVWDKFSATDANVEWLAAEHSKAKPYSKKFIADLMSDRCYSKCSNIRSSFKSKNQKVPAFVKGYENRVGAGGKGGAAIDWEAEAAKFD